ncbi:MAG: PDZ domain-containing protein [Deltaproteobacteria bacterium]|nr:PDZ domain-containing protein [Deltaproteobacteria bacterium]MBI3293842.1 PDZ domain-containing protein [Deltaproteobacteria bacterium]
MSDDENSRKVPRRLTEMLAKTRSRTSRGLRRLGPGVKRIGASIRKRIPRNINLRKINPQQLAQYPGLLRWGLIVCVIYLLSGVAAKTIGLFIRPTFSPLPPKRMSGDHVTTRPKEDFDSINRRNMFNVEGKIPDAFDQGLLDCLSQARPSTQRLVLHGTIVTSSDTFSVALVQEEGKADKLAVKKDDIFFDKYLALKVDRKKLCFQVQSTQELEFIQIPEDNIGTMGASLEGRARMDGIMPTSENAFSVRRSFLDEKLGNLNQILQTARAVPFLEPGTNKFKGFLVQSIDPDSPFASLGVRQGDVLSGVNDILLDNPGKGLEAFTKLKNSPRVSLKVIRGGQEMEITYDVK